MTEERLDMRSQWHLVGNYTNCFDCQRKIISCDLQAPNGPVIMIGAEHHVCPDCQTKRNKQMHEKIFGKEYADELAQNAQK